MIQTYINNKKLNPVSGFTLIELMVVISIIGLLAATLFTSTRAIHELARDNTRVADMHNIRTAINLFYNDNGRFPDEANDGVSNSGEFIGVGDDIDSVLAPYIDPVPRDPLHDGTLYFYAYDPIHEIDMDCSLPSAETGIVYGFNYAEEAGGADGVISRQTCLGSDMNLDNAAFNRALIIR
jgi:prepilin-type N-terminal cleavage/methylation domain-containing protein